MKIILGLIGLSFGLFVSAGAFTVLLSAGMITRFAGKLAIAKHSRLLEECVILGVVAGGMVDILLSLEAKGYPLSLAMKQLLYFPHSLSMGMRKGLLCLNGWFSGIFVGCLAMTIAELMDAIPIFARRTGLKKGLELATLALAIGKLVGSCLYFL